MPASTITVTRDGPVGLITLNRPPANSYDLDFVTQFAAAVEEVGRDEAIHSVVVASALGKFFSAGADVKSFGESSYDVNMALIQAEHAVLEQIEKTPKVFIAMIAGHCLGGGLEIALACDLRFAAEGEYRVGLPEVTLGLLPGNGGTQRLPRLIGRPRALDLMITGRAISPQEALNLGIFDRLWPAGELEANTMAYARAVAEGASFAAGSIKLAVNEGLQMPLHDALAYERTITARIFQSQDAQEGIRSFMDKRKPAFVGR